MTLTHLGEQYLDQWLNNNARVCWLEHDQPWVLEEELLSRLSLPLNLQGNAHHPFTVQLTELRQAAKQAAREMPIAQEGNQQRRIKPC
jgi:hypothetical protein